MLSKLHFQRERAMKYQSQDQYPDLLLRPQQRRHPRNRSAHRDLLSFASNYKSTSLHPLPNFPLAFSLLLTLPNTLGFVNRDRRRRKNRVRCLSLFQASQSRKFKYLSRFGLDCRMPYFRKAHKGPRSTSQTVSGKRGRSHFGVTRDLANPATKDFLITGKTFDDDTKRNISLDTTTIVTMPVRSPRNYILEGALMRWAGRWKKD
jgi:hypothetical protein